MNRRWIPILIALSVLVLATIACGSSNTGEKVTSQPGSQPAAAQPTGQSSGQSAATKPTSQPAATQAPAQPKPQTYNAGDVVKVEDHTIVLNAATVNGNTLVANFTVDNQGTKDLAVSSMLSFDAKDSEGSKLDQAIVDCPSGHFDGKVLPGDKLKGNICWTVPSGASDIRIYYTASLFGSGAVVWAVGSNAGGQPAAAQPTSQPAAAPAPAKPQGQSYNAGDVVKIDDHTIVLNSAKIDAGTLVANFTVNNQGSKDVTVSSMMSFEAKDSEGSKLDQAIVDCPSGHLDGTVLPGDKLKGNICWAVPAGAKGIRIYYTANLFGSGAVVWAVD
jgi:hypothetical protein